MFFLGPRVRDRKFNDVENNKIVNPSSFQVWDHSTIRVASLHCIFFEWSGPRSFEGVPERKETGVTTRRGDVASPHGASCPGTWCPTTPAWPWRCGDRPLSASAWGWGADVWLGVGLRWALFLNTNIRNNTVVGIYGKVHPI